MTRTRSSLLIACLIALPLLCVIVGQAMSHRADAPQVPQEPVVIATEPPAAAQDDAEDDGPDGDEPDDEDERDEDQDDDD